MVDLYQCLSCLNNCVPVEKEFKVTVCGKSFKVKGVLYCQQNSLNKACAQVALRSLILNATDHEDISYRKIHDLAMDGGKDFDPGGGLSAWRIQKVLHGLSIPFEDMDYSVLNDPEVNKLIQEVCTVLKKEGHTLSEVDQQHLEQLISYEAESSLENALAPLRNDSCTLSWNCIEPFFEGYGTGLKGKVKSLISNYRISNANFRIRSPISKLREQYPYQKYLYAGVESGGGALLGFDLAVPVGERGGRHIVPVYGHTFNKDTWVPNATNAYFRVGKDTQYVTSSNWLSSYLMHDDNFGPNYCLPRSYVLPEQVSYILSILREGSKYGGLTAEAIGIDLLYTIGAQVLDPKESWHNQWHQRLLESIRQEEVVLRAVCLTRDEYVQHLRDNQDWSGKMEFKMLPGLLFNSLPKMIWMVEYSVPELFPTNLSKLGELLFDATILPDEKKMPDYGVFLLGRFPGVYVLKQKTTTGGVPYIFYKSNFKSHTKVFTFDN